MRKERVEKKGGHQTKEREDKGERERITVIKKQDTIFYSNKW